MIGCSLGIFNPRRDAREFPHLPYVPANSCLGLYFAPPLTEVSLCPAFCMPSRSLRRLTRTFPSSHPRTVSRNGGPRIPLPRARLPNSASSIAPRSTACGRKSSSRRAAQCADPSPVQPCRLARAHRLLHFLQHDLGRIDVPPPGRRRRQISRSAIPPRPLGLLTWQHWPKTTTFA